MKRPYSITTWHGEGRTIHYLMTKTGPNDEDWEIVCELPKEVRDKREFLTKLANMPDGEITGVHISFNNEIAVTVENGTERAGYNIDTGKLHCTYLGRRVVDR